MNADSLKALLQSLPRESEWVEFKVANDDPKRLREHPGRERALWAALAKQPFETALAAQGLTGVEVLSRLDYPRYFDLSQRDLPANRSGILDRLAEEKLIVPEGW